MTRGRAWPSPGPPGCRGVAAPDGCPLLSGGDGSGDGTGRGRGRRYNPGMTDPHDSPPLSPDRAGPPAGDREAGAGASDHGAVAAVRAAIAEAGGRITFARFMAIALYHPEHGYYLSEARRPGRGGDFLTAPETHPFFGIALSRQVVEAWERLGRPGRFVVREHGAGVGGLAYDILVGIAQEAPALLDAIDYRLVEPNRHRVLQALAAMDEVGFGGLVRGEEPPAAGGALPPEDGFLLANEVPDALPAHRLVWEGGEPRERWVVWQGDGFGEETGPLSADAAAFDPAGRLARAGVRLAEGDRFEVSPAATAWMAAAAAGLRRGYALVVDYGYDTAELYRGHRLEGTVRAHRGHRVTDDPFAAVGEADLTAHVDFGALRQAGEAAGLTFAGLTTQGALLASLDMGDLLVGLGRDPATTAAEYVAAQAATIRLIDPGGMGRFRALLMARDAPVEPPLRGLRERGPTF